MDGNPFPSITGNKATLPFRILLYDLPCQKHLPDIARGHPLFTAFNDGMAGKGELVPPDFGPYSAFPRAMESATFKIFWLRQEAALWLWHQFWGANGLPTNRRRLTSNGG